MAGASVQAKFRFDSIIILEISKIIFHPPAGGNPRLTTIATYIISIFHRFPAALFK